MTQEEDSITPEEYKAIASTSKRFREKSNRIIQQHLASTLNTSTPPPYPEVWSTHQDRFFNVVVGNEFLSSASPFLRGVWEVSEKLSKFADQSKLDDLMISRESPHESIRPFAGNVHDIADRVLAQDFSGFGLHNMFLVEKARQLRPLVSAIAKEKLNGSIEDSNYTRYKFTRTLQQLDNDFMMRLIKELHSTDPDAVIEIFGAPKISPKGNISLPNFNSKLTTLYLGKLDGNIDLAMRNDVNPFIYFDFDPGTSDIGQFRRVLTDRYGSSFSSSAVDELEKIVIEEASKSLPDFKNLPDFEKRRHLRKETNARDLLGKPSIVKRIYDLANGKSPLAAATKSGADVDGFKASYEKFARDVGIYDGLRWLEGKSKITNLDYSEVPEKPEDNMTLTLCPGKQPFNHVKKGYFIDMDTIGFASAATDPEANLDPFELHKRQVKTILEPLRHAGEELGGYFVKMVGDEIYMMFEDPETLVYFANAVKTTHKDKIADDLVQHAEGKMKSLDKDIAVLVKRAEGSGGQYQIKQYSASPVTKDMLKKAEGRKLSESRRIDAIRKHIPDVRVAGVKGEAHKDGVEYSGTGPIRNARYMNHKKGVDIPFDIGVYEDVYSNFNGIGFDSATIDDLEKKLQGDSRFNRYSGIQFGNETLDFAEYQMRTGEKLILRSISSNPIYVSKEISDIPWKVIQDEGEELKATAALAEHKRKMNLVAQSNSKSVTLALDSILKDDAAPSRHSYLGDSG